MPEIPSIEEQVDAGRRRRKEVPRSSLAEIGAHERDPLGILDEQNATRIQSLIPLRIERMSQSPFAFYRGTAALMADDLAAGAHSGILVASCGDAHVSNFGFYASPQRTLVFDLNDFDEAAWAPWEWDLKRLVTSVIIGGRAGNRSDAFIRKAALHTVETYCWTLRRALDLTPTERYFTHLDADAGVHLLDKRSRKTVKRAIKQARRRTGERAVSKLTRVDENGELHFVFEPPRMTPIEEADKAGSETYLDQYVRSASPDIWLLMRHYEPVDFARRVVGVGSVGTRCTLTLWRDGDDHALILQSKEANRSVLEQYGRIAQPPQLGQLVAEHGEGCRVVSLQRILQAVSDPFLGYLRAAKADLYVRQFHDMKGSIEVEDIDNDSFLSYVAACAGVLARAHSQSPAVAEIVGYAGRGEVLGEAILAWSTAYADLSARDFEAFVAANKPA